MISLAFACIYLFLLTLGLGRLALNIAARGKPPHLPAGLRLLLSVLTGFTLLAFLAGVWSLFYPLAWTFHLIAALLALAGHLLPPNRPNPGLILACLRSSPLAFTVFLLIAAAVLLFALLPPNNPDTGIYHAQSVRWIEEYRAVPGLGNLNGRLAYNSSWYLLVAFGGFRFLGFDTLPAAFSFLLLVSCAFFLYQLYAAPRAPQSWLLSAVFLPAALLLSSPLIAAATTDLPVMLLVWIILLLFVDNASRPHAGSLMVEGILVVLAAFALTLKLTAFPVLLLAGWVLARRWAAGERRMAAAVAALFLIFLIPWLARSLVLSGYLIYPFPALDLFAFDWKMPPSLVHYEQVYITHWAWSHSPPSDGLDLISPSIADWLARYHPLQIALLPLSLLGIVTVPLLKPFRCFSLESRCILPLFFFLALLFWYITAPDFRFAYPFMLPAALWLFSMLFSLLLAASRSQPRILLTALSLLMIFILLMIAGAFMLADWQPSLLWAPRTYPLPELKVVALSGIDINVPVDGEFCWNVALPCTPFLHSGLTLRGPALSDGFRIKTASHDS